LQGNHRPGARGCALSSRLSMKTRSMRRPAARPRWMSCLLRPWKSLPPVGRSENRLARSEYFSTRAAS